jgi:hypothetical protein
MSEVAVGFKMVQNGPKKCKNCPKKWYKNGPKEKKTPKHFRTAANNKHVNRLQIEGGAKSSFRI